MHVVNRLDSDCQEEMRPQLDNLTRKLNAFIFNSGRRIMLARGDFL
jgi:hypothetical protein